MEKPTKLQETELQELKDFQNQSESLIAQLGQLSFRKLQLEKEEQYLKQAFEQIVTAEVELSKKLKETYGDVQIDLKEGDIIYS
jgi:predicted transcriptional regulator